jgi:hypothetical protein
MRIYLFGSESHSVRGFTADATGADLPTDYAPWSALDTGTAITAGPADRLSAIVRRDGFFLLSGNEKGSKKKLARG